MYNHLKNLLGKSLCLILIVCVLAIFARFFQPLSRYTVTEISLAPQVYAPGASHRQYTDGRYINAAGQSIIVKCPLHDPDEGYTSLLLTRGYTRSLGSLGGNKAFASDLNALGHVVGWSRTTRGEDHAFLWRDGRMRRLGTLGGTRSYAYALNDHDEVVGMAETATGKYHAFLWKDTGMTDLGVQEPGQESYAFGINNRGEVVGRVDNDADNYHAVLWHNGKLTDLNCLICHRDGMVLDKAVRISDRGQIEAYGWINLSPHYFRLTPY